MDDATTHANLMLEPAPTAISVGSVDFGDVGRPEPIGRKFGFDRGLCIDRFYIERFLASQAEHIRGRVLEVADDAYTRRFGGARVTSRDVLHVRPGNRRATLIGDLACPEQFPADVFDCIILTQTLQHIYDVRAALATIRRMLRHDGVALISAAGISQISRYDMERWGDYWRFTTCSLSQLLADTFGTGSFEVAAHGNVRAAVAFLHGLCVEDVGAASLRDDDDDYQLVLTAVARKSDEAA